MKGKGKRAFRAKQQVRTEWGVFGAHLNSFAANPRSRLEVAPLIILAVIGQIGLRDHAENGAIVYDNRGIVERSLPLQRSAHNQRRKKLARCFDKPGKRRLDGILQCVLKEKIVDCVRGKAELRKQYDSGLGRTA